MKILYNDTVYNYFVIILRNKIIDTYIWNKILKEFLAYENLYYDVVFALKKVLLHITL